jgi:hypothetical protein
MINLNSSLDDKVAHIVKRYDSGAFGTVESPKRSATGYEVFWRVVFGYQEASAYRNTMAYPFAKAGKIVKNRAEVVR